MTSRIWGARRALVFVGALVALAAPGSASAVVNPLDQPVPAEFIVQANGLEWVWAAPCAEGDFYCGTGRIKLGKDGFNYATPAQWAKHPAPSAFGPVLSSGQPAKCAAPYFFTGYGQVGHCDAGDPDYHDGGGAYSQGAYGSAPLGGLPSGDNGLQVMPQVAETWLVRTGVRRGRCADSLDAYRAAVVTRSQARQAFVNARDAEHAARTAYYAGRTTALLSAWQAATTLREAAGQQYQAAKDAAAAALEARRTCVAGIAAARNTAKKGAAPKGAVSSVAAR